MYSTWCAERLSRIDLPMTKERALFSTHAARTRPCSRALPLLPPPLGLACEGRHRVEHFLLEAAELRNAPGRREEATKRGERARARGTRPASSLASLDAALVVLGLVESAAVRARTSSIAALQDLGALRRPREVRARALGDCLLALLPRALSARSQHAQLSGWLHPLLTALLSTLSPAPSYKKRPTSSKSGRALVKLLSTHIWSPRPSRVDPFLPEQPQNEPCSTAARASLEGPHVRPLWPSRASEASSARASSWPRRRAHSFARLRLESDTRAQLYVDRRASRSARPRSLVSCRRSREIASRSCCCSI